MTEVLPSPLTPPDCDCRDLDGFMLNVERLMASELVALSTHEEIGAALLLWCRAWKQQPAASLPDDDRVNAAFARMPMPKFKKMKEAVLRGFVKCSDGRLYHAVLAQEAIRAFERKTAFRAKRDSDAKRLKTWRQTRKGNGNETPEETVVETPSETRFVQEGQGRDRDGTGQGVIPLANANGRAAPSDGSDSRPAWWPKVDRYGRIVSPVTDKTSFQVGRAILGNSNGWLVKELRDACRFNDTDVVDLLLQAETKDGPVAWLKGVIKNRDGDGLPLKREIYPPEIYTDGAAR